MSNISNNVSRYVGPEPVASAVVVKATRSTLIETATKTSGQFRVVAGKNWWAVRNNYFPSRVCLGYGKQPLFYVDVNKKTVDLIQPYAPELKRGVREVLSGANLTEGE